MSSLLEHRPPSYEDVLALPDNLTGQIIDGELFATPRPAIGHQRSEALILVRIGDPFDMGQGGPGGWWIFLDVDVRFTAHDVVRPDVAGWRRERLPQPNVRPIDVVPDWVCEVLSPSTAARDRVYKLEGA